MNMSLIADLADVLAAGAVVASLIFVAHQIKQNTAQMKNAHWGSVVQRINLFHSRAFDQETAAVLEKGQKSYGNLNDAERLTYEGWMHEFVLGYGTASALVRQGVIDPEVGKLADQRVRWLFRHQGNREWWTAKDRVPFAPATISRIDGLIKGSA